MAEKIKIWGRVSSTNVQKVLWLLDELDQDYERVDAGMKFGVVNTPEYLAMNPNGRVPLMQHGDLTLWESEAIMRYLAATFGEGVLWKTTPAGRAKTDQWLSWSSSSLVPVLFKVFLASVRTAPSKQNPEATKSAISEASVQLNILDAQLSLAQYVAGDSFTMADIACSSWMYRWFTMDIERPALPNLDRWYDLLQQRPAFKKWAMASFESLRAHDE